MTTRSVAPKKTLEEKFWEKVERIPEAGCWIWMGGCTSGGYGRCCGKYAHRLSYEMHIGEIPQGLEIDHLCRIHCCVNPAHLEPVTHKVNLNRGMCADVQRSRHAARTHCPQGHAYDDENTYFYPGGRKCKSCILERVRERRRISKELFGVSGP